MGREQTLKDENKNDKFDKILENLNQSKKRSDSLKKGGIRSEEQLRMCVSMKKLKTCPDGDSCPFAHSLEEIKYYRPHIWKNVMKSLCQDKSPINTERLSTFQQPQLAGLYQYNDDVRQINKGKFAQSGKSELMEACRTNNFQGIAELIANGALINQKDFVTVSFVKITVYTRCNLLFYQALEELIRCGKHQLDRNVTYANNYGNILHITAQYADSRFLSKLVGVDIYDVNLVDRFGRSPLFYSVIRDDFDSVKVIGNDSYLNFEDVYGKCLIDYARETRDEQILCFLVDQGENLGNNFQKGIPLLFECIYQGYYLLFQSLIKKGVPISSTDPKTGDNVLSLSYSMKNMQIFNYLINSSDSKIYSMTDSSGQTILFKCILHKDMSVIEKLMGKDGLIIDQQDSEGKTALMYACEIDSVEIVRIILKNYNCNLNLAEKHGQTAAMFAAMNDNIEILKELFLRKFNINWQDNLGNHLYDHAKSEEARSMILEYIRDLEDISDKDKLTIIQILTARYQQLRPGSMSHNSSQPQLSTQQHSKLQTHNRIKHARMKQVLQDIDDEYKRELEREGINVKKGNDKLIHEKFIQSKIAMMQLTKQAMHKAKDNFQWKDKLVENYFLKEERKAQDELVLMQKQHLFKKLKPEILAQKIIKERKKLESNATPSTTATQFMPRSTSVPSLKLPQTPVNAVFSRLREARHKRDKNFQEIVSTLSRRESMGMNNRKCLLLEKTQSQNNLAEFLHFKKECPEKLLLDKILSKHELPMKAERKINDRILFNGEEIEIFKDQQYTAREINKYFRTEQKFFTPRLI